MCGLAGFLNAARDQTADQLRLAVGRMADRLHHRGPDDTGIWIDPANGIALGFKRLSIVDLSEAGHQPMTSASGRFVIAFNGEIYNHQALRDELATKGRSFRGRSDTEVLIEGFAEWGIDRTLARCIGMFAFAVWDTQRQEVTLGRDRLGKKPLYVGRVGQTVVFASETKAFRAHSAFRAEVNRQKIGELLTYSYLPQGSIYRDVMTVTPGTTLTISLADDGFWSGQPFPTAQPFWSFESVANAGLMRPFAGSYSDATEQLDQLLRNAVGCRMLADVPLGAFLSGGIDSSTVVALMQQQSSRPVKTFTIGFEEESYNEAPFAKRVADHLRTDHTELYVTAKAAQDVIPLLPKIFDEPFADSSQIPTYLVSQLARQHVTVALSGDGGDELFCGYRRYFEALSGFFAEDNSSAAQRSSGGMMTRLAKMSRRFPAGLRRTISRLCGLSGTLLPRRQSRLMGVAADVFSDLGPHHRYLRNLTHWHGEDAADLGIVLPDQHSVAQELSRWCGRSDSRPEEFQRTWQAYDTLNYLPGDILTKVDRATMAVSLEGRMPLLDHRVVEFAWTLPQEFKVQQGIGKRILRDVLARYVPREMFERPKVGFGVPIDAWLRGPLRDWAEDLLNEERLRRERFLRPDPIRRLWQEHLSGRSDRQYPLWDVLMFQAWLAEYPAQ